MFPPASWIQKLGWRTATCSHWSCRDFRSPGIFKMYPSTASTYLSQKKTQVFFELGWMVTGHREVFSVCFEKIGRSLLACCTIYLYASLSTLFSSPSSPNMVSLYLFHANVQIKTWARPHEHVRIPHVCGDSRCFMAVFWLSAGNVGNSLDYESIQFLLPKPSWRPVIQMLGIVSL